MPRVLVVESATREIAPLLRLLAQEGVEVELCPNGKAAERVIAERVESFAAAFLLWSLASPPFAFELLAQCRQRWPELPVVVLFEELTAELATRAFALGANDVLEKPLEAERISGCLRALWGPGETESPLFAKLRAVIPGQSPKLLAVFRH